MLHFYLQRSHGNETNRLCLVDTYQRKQNEILNFYHGPNFFELLFLSVWLFILTTNSERVLSELTQMVTILFSPPFFFFGNGICFEDGYGTTLTGREQFDYIFFYLNFCSIVSFSEEDTLDGNGCLYLLLFYDPI